MHYYSIPMRLFTLGLTLLFIGCAPTDPDIADGWSGTIDTLTSGEVVVHNEGTPLWSPEEAWQVVEEFRIGSDTGEDAIIFGTIRSFDVDADGQIYVLDDQSQEIHVFDGDGTYVRTAGTQGPGPGEFENAGAVDISPNGEILVMEMPKGRLTVLGSDGLYRRMVHINSTGWHYSTYPGGMDRTGRYNGAVLVGTDEDSKLMLARFDESFAPLDTVAYPESPVEYDYYELILEGGGSVRAGIPFQGSLEWRFSLGGNFWTLYTGTYELTEVTADGTVLRRIRMKFEPIPVTAQDKAELRPSFQWFTDQGGKVDLSRIPNTRPVVSSFFSDDRGNLWVKRVALSPDDADRLFDVFDAEGRFLGGLNLPFGLRSDPEPVVRSGILYGISEDEDGSSVVVIARVVTPDG